MILGQATRGFFRKRFMVGEVTEEKNAAKQQCHEMQVPTRCGKMPVVFGLSHLNLSISEYIICTSMYISLLYISVLNKHGPVMFRYYGLQRPARCPILSMQGWGSKMLRHLRITKAIGSFWYLSPLTRKTSRISYLTIHFLTREFLKYYLIGEKRINKVTSQNTKTNKQTNKRTNKQTDKQTKKNKPNKNKPNKATNKQNKTTKTSQNKPDQTKTNQKNRMFGSFALKVVWRWSARHVSKRCAATRRNGNGCCCSGGNGGWRRGSWDRHDKVHK